MRSVKASRRRALILPIVLLLLLASSVGALAQVDHGGAIPNTHNDMYIVQGEAENPREISAGYGEVVVREAISFANTDPNLTTNYGIAYVSPNFEWDDLFPRVTRYVWDYEVANYTVQLVNETSGYVGNYTGITNDTVVIDPSDVNPDEPGQPDPRVNGTYMVNVLVIDITGTAIIEELWGWVTIKHNESTVIDLSLIELPPIGPNKYVADDLDLFEMSLNLIFEPHTNLTAGFYRVYIGETVFHFGTQFNVDVQYRSVLNNGKLSIEKLIFLRRPIDIDVYLEDGMEVKVHDGANTDAPLLSPTHVSEGPGDPTSFYTENSCVIKVQEEGTDGTDWGVIGRYVILFGVIALLVIAVLWSGPKRRSGDEAEDEYDDDDVDDEEVGEEDEDGAPGEGPKEKGPSEEEKDTEKRREELERRKATLIGELKSLDARHEDGALTDKEWKFTRAALKERAVEVMKELEDLHEGHDAE